MREYDSLFSAASLCLCFRASSAALRPCLRSARRKGTRIPSPRWVQARRTSWKSGGVRPWNLLGSSATASVPFPGPQRKYHPGVLFSVRKPFPGTNRRRSRILALGFQKKKKEWPRPRTEHTEDMLLNANVGTGVALAKLPVLLFQFHFGRLFHILSIPLCNSFSDFPIIPVR